MSANDVVKPSLQPLELRTRVAAGGRRSGQAGALPRPRTKSARSHKQQPLWTLQPSRSSPTSTNWAAWRRRLSLIMSAQSVTGSQAFGGT